MKLDELQEIVDGSVTKALETVTDDQKEAVETAITAALDKQATEVITPLENRIQLIQDEKDKGDEDGSYGFKNLGEFAIAVKNYDVSRGVTVDERLIKAAGDPTMAEAQGPEGGHLVPTMFSTAMLEKNMTNDESLMGRCSQIPLQTGSLDLPIVDDSDRSGGNVFGGVKWYNVTELEQRTATKPKLYEISLKLNDLAGLAYMSNDLLEDSPVSIEALLKRGFEAGFVLKTNEAIINGTGAGEPLGIMNAACILQISKETGQDAATIVYENILNMIARSTSYRNSVWLAIPDALPQLATMSLSVGTGGSAVYVPATQDGQFDRLMGRPVIYNDYCQALGTAGDLLLVDFNDYIIATKSGKGSGIQFASSIHLKFDFDQQAFRFKFRWDGQSWRNAAFSPLRGSSRSPFIKLETRS